MHANEIFNRLNEVQHNIKVRQDEAEQRRRDREYQMQVKEKEHNDKQFERHHQMAQQLADYEVRANEEIAKADNEHNVRMDAIEKKIQDSHNELNYVQDQLTQ